MKELLANIIPTLFLASACIAATPATAGQRQPLTDGWLLKSSVLVSEDGARISTVGYKPQRWLKTSVPSTVLGALVKNGVYPDPRVGMNSLRMPDSSDEFNRKHDLAKFSYLSDKRNPWRDPYWYRTEFSLSMWPKGRRFWLEFKGINYRAEVWLNGSRLADPKAMVGIYRRFRFDITDCARPGTNCLAVKIHPVDHPGEPDTQLIPYGPSRKYFKKEIQKDVTYTVGVGYDCMPAIPDRNMGIWQEVCLDSTGPVDIRDPFVAPDLPLPKTSPALLTVSADLVNATSSPQKGVCRGVLMEGGAEFCKDIELQPGETRRVVFSPAEFPQLAIANPHLWWPRNYGPQYLYHLRLTFEADKQTSDAETVTFGIRKVTGELHWFNGTPGLRIHVNGQKVFSQGGWLQPELLFEMPAHRMEAEVRYLTEANLNTVTVEDLPVLTDEFLDACDRHGLMFWMSFYSSYWVQLETDWPLDHALLAQCGTDVIKRHWNHPSVVLYSCVGEGAPSKDIYLTWRKNLLALDRTRLFIPTIDVRQKLEWLQPDLPTGLHDDGNFWEVSPAGYYEKVRVGKKWMFNTEVSIASLPPVSSLRKFLPALPKDAAAKPAPFPADEAWAHHDASHYIKDYDPAIRRLYGDPRSIEDYCWKAHLLTAERHRAWSEAANHRMWDITSGVWQWKLNSCWPSVGWQIYDWYLRPMVSAYYYRSAFEPLHVQLSPLDRTVTVVNRRLQPAPGLRVSAQVFDSRMNLRWEKHSTTGVDANTYRDVLAVPPLESLTPVYFADLKLRDAQDRIVSRNFYWLSAKEPADFRDLSALSMTVIKASFDIERAGDETVVRVRVANPTDRIAFFIQLALTRPADGEEILPVFWEDNYFSLLPGETRGVTTRLATRDLRNARPKLEVGGWNIQTDCRCTALKASKSVVKPGEEITVTAMIAGTFLNGSRVALLVDDLPVDTQWSSARGGKTVAITFKLRLPQSGKHRLTVANRTVEVEVE